MIKGSSSGIKSYYDYLNHLLNDRYINLKKVQEREADTQLVVSVHQNHHLIAIITKGLGGINNFCDFLYHLENDE